MNKYIILSLCIINTINSMEQAPDTAPLWHKHDTLLAPVFIHYLEKYNIQTKDRVILNLECGTGALAAKLAQKSDRVWAYDQHNHLINFAHKTYNHSKVAFEQRHPESFSSRLAHLAVIDSSIDYIENQQKMFECIHNYLSDHNGELFITAPTHENRYHPKIITAREMAPDIRKTLSYFTEEEITALIIPQYPSIGKLRSMLEETNFKIIKIEKRSDYLPVTEQQVQDLYTPVIISMAIFELITTPEDKKEFIEKYIKLYTSKLEKFDDNKLREPIITTIIHAQKIKNNS